MGELYELIVVSTGADATVPILKMCFQRERKELDRTGPKGGDRRPWRDWQQRQEPQAPGVPRRRLIHRLTLQLVASKKKKEIFK